MGHGVGTAPPPTSGQGTRSAERPASRRPAAGRRHTIGLDAESEATGFTQQQFVENASRLGWYGGFEMLLFSSLDVRGTGFVVPADVSAWFDAEHAFHEKRSASRMKRTKNPARGTRIAAQHALKSFKVFLRSKWRYLFHAWRAKLDRDGSMTVARKELWKTCAELGWHGDVNALWHSLDSDDSGSCTLDEFTVAEARPLAIFRRAAVERYGSVLRQFRALLSAAKVKGPGGRLSRAAWGAASTMPPWCSTSWTGRRQAACACATCAGWTPGLPRRG